METRTETSGVPGIEVDVMAVELASQELEGCIHRLGASRSRYQDAVQRLTARLASISRAIQALPETPAR